MGQRQDLQRQAEYNYQRVRNQVHGQIRREVRNLGYADELVDLAHQAVTFRTEMLRLTENAVDAGERTETDALEARAELARAQADLLKAELNRCLAVVRLRKISGYPLR